MNAVNALILAALAGFCHCHRDEEVSLPRLLQPLQENEFLESYMGQRYIHITNPRGSQGSHRFERLFGTLHDLTASADHTFAHSLRAGISLKSQGKPFSLETITLASNISSGLQLALDQGRSAVVRYEAVTQGQPPAINELAKLFAEKFNLPVTVHAYLSGKGDMALAPHTDPYDTFILQLSGSKTWKVLRDTDNYRSSCSCNLNRHVFLGPFQRNGIRTELHRIFQKQT